MLFKPFVKAVIILRNITIIMFVSERLKIIFKKKILSPFIKRFNINYLILQITIKSDNFSAKRIFAY